MPPRWPGAGDSGAKGCTPNDHPWKRLFVGGAVGAALGGALALSARAKDIAPVYVLLGATAGIYAALPRGPVCDAASRHGFGTGPEVARALVDHAIARAGGAKALTRAHVLAWEGTAVVADGGRTVPLTGRWVVQPPDSAVVATYETARGPSSTRRLVVAGTRGWVERDGGRTPLADAVAVSEREQLYLYEVVRLVALRDSAVHLTRALPDTSGHLGVHAARAGWPDVTLYVDDRGRLAHVQTLVLDARTGTRRREDLWLAGTIKANGVRWPRTWHLTVDDAPFFDLTIDTLHVRPNLEAEDHARLTAP